MNFILPGLEIQKLKNRKKLEETTYFGCSVKSPHAPVPLVSILCSAMLELCTLGVHPQAHFSHLQRMFLIGIQLISGKGKHQRVGGEIGIFIPARTTNLLPPSMVLE